jgi:predicted nucleotidyltransferase
MLDLTPHRNALADFARRWRVTELALFGSALRDDFGPESDVDLLVTFDPDAPWSLFDLVEMKLDLEELFGREVDVMTRRAIEKSSNWIRRESILNTALPIYAPD